MDDLPDLTIRSYQSIEVLGRQYCCHEPDCEKCKGKRYIIGWISENQLRYQLRSDDED